MSGGSGLGLYFAIPGGSSSGISLTSGACFSTVDSVFGLLFSFPGFLASFLLSSGFLEFRLLDETFPLLGLASFRLWEDNPLFLLCAIGPLRGFRPFLLLVPEPLLEFPAGVLSLLRSFPSES